MHEMSIAIEILAQLERVAAENDLARVDTLTIRAGLLRGIVPEALDIAFASAAEGTLAEGASIELQVVPTRARCRSCGREFEPTTDAFLCPQCRLADVDLLSGNEIVLLSVQGRSKNEREKL